MDAYQQIPIFTYLSQSINDDINQAGCPYVGASNSWYFGHNDTYADSYASIVPFIREPVCSSFNYANEKCWNLKYQEYYDDCDALLSENMEGVDKRYPYSQEEWYYIREV